MGSENNSINKLSKNTEDYIPKFNNPNAKSISTKNLNLKKSNFTIDNPFQNPNKQFETSYEIGFNDKFDMRNKTLYNFKHKTSINISRKEEGNYNSEYQKGFPFKVNSLTDKEIKEKRVIVENTKKHHWENGLNRGLFYTTNNQFFKYNNNYIKNANNTLSEEYKNDLRSSHHVLGKGKNQFITTQLNSFLPINPLRILPIDEKLRNSSINFNKTSKNFYGKTVYMNDYTLKAVDQNE